MIAPAVLLERTSQRLLRQRQVNVLGFFLPLAVATGAACRVVLAAFSLPALLALVPVALCGGFLTAALWRARKAVKRETVATLLDEKTGGQDLFLTLATCPQTQPHVPFLALVRHQAASRAASFMPERDVPFTLEKRVLPAFLGAALCVLALFFVPLEPNISLFVPAPSLDAVLTNLEETARALMIPSSTLQEKTAGAQLLTLVQELKDSSLSPQEKRRLIDEAQKRMNLPFPQILPFDLKLFASKSKKDRGQGNQSDEPQAEGKPLAKANQQLEQLKKALSAAGNEPQQGPQQKDGEKKDQPQPHEAGGGIKFNLPQPQSGEKQERSGQEPPGQQQKSTQDQKPNAQAPGSDPNQPGGKRQDQSSDPEKKGPLPNPQQTGQEDKSTGATVGHGPGERFLKPGEQPGGFLTKDARFVKVRVPVGQETQGGDDARTENRNRAVPKTPYSNAPLKEGPPDQVQPKQPMPLEYRAILQQ
ncbi:MAG: hypothetical protein HYZ72_19070 [Deltaproteobacteria bacterium]|nr:hypothetical protein [Deltaproteobacteria bacterium]